MALWGPPFKQPEVVLTNTALKAMRNCNYTFVPLLNRVHHIYIQLYAPLRPYFPRAYTLKKKPLKWSARKILHVKRAEVRLLYNDWTILTWTIHWLVISKSLCVLCLHNCTHHLTDQTSHSGQAGYCVGPFEGLTTQGATPGSLNNQQIVCNDLSVVKHLVPAACVAYAYSNCKCHLRFPFWPLSNHWWHYH